MVIPKPVYETLPVLYVIAGIATITSTSDPVALGSGLLLAFAGLLIVTGCKHLRHTMKGHREVAP